MARTSRRTAVQPELREEKIWNTALYIRLSVEDNGKDSDSIENQQRILESYMADRPFLKKVAVFTDNGYTGTDFLRPAFQEMMEAVQEGSVNCILVKDLSRLGRNYIETSQFIEKLCPFYGLRFIAVNDHYDTETITSEGQLSASLQNIVNDYYAKDISRKVTTALQGKMERGDYIGNYAPYGYQKDPNNKNRLLVDAETASIVRMIFRWRAGGLSYMGINKRLNDMAIPSPSQHKLFQGIETNNNKKDRTILWNKHMITELLKNMIYVGRLVQKKGSQCLYAGIPYHLTEEDEWIVVQHTHEPIIEEALFEKVQRINQEATSKQKANVGKYDHLPKEKNLYGKKLTCAHCGAIMKLHRSFSTKKDKVYFMFKCPTYAEHGTRACSDVKMRKADLDETVFAFLRSQMELFVDMDKTVRNLQSAKKKQKKVAACRQEIRSVKQKLEQKKSALNSTYIDLKEGLLSQEDYVHHRRILTEDIQALEHQLSQTMDDRNPEQFQETNWKALVERFYSGTELTAEMIEAFVQGIKLREDGSLEINLSYADELAALKALCEKLRKEIA